MPRSGSRRCPPTAPVPERQAGAAAVISRRNPMKDQIAIAQHGDDRLHPAQHRSVGAVIRDGGVRRGAARHRAARPTSTASSGQPAANVLQHALGIPEVCLRNVQIPFVNQVGTAMEAIAAGLCEVVLAYRTAPQCGVHRVGAA